MAVLPLFNDVVNLTRGPGTREAEAGRCVNLFVFSCFIPQGSSLPPARSKAAVFLRTAAIARVGCHIDTLRVRAPPPP